MFWWVYAIASGAIAAFTGVLAKLTSTTDGPLRAVFFALNLAFNSIMWSIFTMALKKSKSSSQVTVVNTTTNFLSTAILGWMLFQEGHDTQWCIGIACMLVGTGIIAL